MLALPEVKLFLRVDHDEEDALIESIMGAAREYAEKSTGKTYNDTPLWDLLVKQITAHWYENRNPVAIGGAPAEIPYTLRCLLTHIATRGDLA